MPSQADTADRSSALAGQYREKIVPPLQGRRETIFIFLALCLIALLTTIRALMLIGEDPAFYIRPYQGLISELDNPERTLYQSLLSSVPEIEALREEEGQWPEAALLEIDSVPPFDSRYLPVKMQGYKWTEYDGSSWVDYIGTDPTATQRRTFLLRVIDLHAEYHPHPHPGIDYDPNMRVATQVWIYEDPNRPYPGERVAESGWKWIVIPGDPSLSVTEEQAQEANKAYTPAEQATPAQQENLP